MNGRMSRRKFSLWLFNRNLAGFLHGSLLYIMGHLRTKKSSADYRRETAETRAFLWQYHAALCETLGIDPRAKQPHQVVAHLCGRLGKQLPPYCTGESAPGA